MKRVINLIVGLGLLILIFALIFSFSDTLKSILFSWVFGIFVFVLSILILNKLFTKHAKNKYKGKLLNKHLKKIEKRNYFVGFIIFVIAVVLFLNFYLNFQALLGNDLLISLKLDKENFVLKNGETVQLNIKTSILTNPFCKANCSLRIEDLAKGEIILTENNYIKFSKPLSNDYSLFADEITSGQKLYQISLECKTIKNTFCYSTEDYSKIRTRIISLDHSLNENQELKREELKGQTELLNNQFNLIKNNLEILNFNVSFLDLSEFETEAQSLGNLSDSLSKKISSLNNFYLTQEYSQAEKMLPKIKEEMDGFQERFKQFNLSISQIIDVYNTLTRNIALIYNETSYLRAYNFSNTSIVYATSFVNNFNLMVSGFGENYNLSRKLDSFNQIYLEKENLFSLLKNETLNNITRENKLNISLLYSPLPRILINVSESVPGFVLTESSRICCLQNNCYECIDNPLINYPIVFVHGHSFNEAVSAELSMESFGDITRELKKEGYIDAGYFYVSKYDENSKGYLGKINESILVKATYYLNTSMTKEGSFIFDSKQESIETYSNRLNEIILNIKYLTGKDKVIIVAHSMGGLVTRKYIQMYGEESLDKVILIGVPNKGIDGFVLTYCPLFGADLECDEMNKDSSFILELNNASIPNVPIKNIIGLGCSRENSDGDGIVKNESAFLEWADNIYFNGTCRGVDFFHITMIKPNKYPEIYNLTRDLIN